MTGGTEDWSDELSTIDEGTEEPLNLGGREIGMERGDETVAIRMVGSRGATERVEVLGTL